MHLSLLSAFIVYSSLLVLVTGHGKLIDPPGRSTAWRFGFNTPVNYNDNELFCGGFVTQWKINDGKCGVCGDAYDSERTNELPDGKFAKNLVVTRKYTRGSIFTATAQLTANHRGHFVFKICPAFTMSVEVTQECLDSNVLEVVNSIDKYLYELPSTKSTNFTVDLKLPEDLVCERCVLQWNYITGNNWGRCKDGTSSVGCGRQENFRNCADIQITEHENDIDGPVPEDNFSSTTSSKSTSTPLSSSTTGTQLSSSTTSTQLSSSTTSTPLSSSTIDVNQTDQSTIEPSSSTKYEPRTTVKRIKGKRTTYWPMWRPRSRTPSTTPYSTFQPKQTENEITPKQEPCSSTKEDSISTSTQSSNIDSNSINTGIKKCVAIGAFAGSEDMISWCQVMCKVNFCPETHCYCS